MWVSCRESIRVNDELLTVARRWLVMVHCSYRRRFSGSLGRAIPPCRKYSTKEHD